MKEQKIVINWSASNKISSDFQIVKVNVSDESENIYAVCSPVKIK